MTSILLLAFMLGFYNNTFGQPNVTVILKDGERYELQSKTLNLLVNASQTIADILGSPQGQQSSVGASQLVLSEISKAMFSEIVQMIKMPKEVMALLDLKTDLLLVAELYKNLRFLDMTRLMKAVQQRLLDLVYEEQDLDKIDAVISYLGPLDTDRLLIYSIKKRAERVTVILKNDEKYETSRFLINKLSEISPVMSTLSKKMRGSQLHIAAITRDQFIQVVKLVSLKHQPPLMNFFIEKKSFYDKLLILQAVSLLELVSLKLPIELSIATQLLKSDEQKREGFMALAKQTLGAGFKNIEVLMTNLKVGKYSFQLADGLVVKPGTEKQQVQELIKASATLTQMEKDTAQTGGRLFDLSLMTKDEFEKIYAIIVNAKNKQDFEGIELYDFTTLVRIFYGADYLDITRLYNAVLNQLVKVLAQLGLLRNEENWRALEALNHNLQKKILSGLVGQLKIDLQTYLHGSFFIPVNPITDAEKLTMAIQEITWNPDNVHLFVVLEKGNLEIWDALIGKRTLKFKSVGTAAWSNDGKKLLTVTAPKDDEVDAPAENGMFRSWEMFSGKLLEEYSLGKAVNSWQPSSWRHDLKKIAYATQTYNARNLMIGFAEGGFAVQELSQRNIRPFIQAFHNSLTALSWNPQGNLIAFGTAVGFCGVFNDEKKKMEYVLDNTGKRINALAWSPDGKLLATGSDGGVLKILNAFDGKVLFIYDAKAKNVNAVCWSPDGHFLMAGLSDGAIMIWDFQMSNLVRVLSSVSHPISSISSSPNGRCLAVGFINRRVDVWRLVDSKELHGLATPQLLLIILAHEEQRAGTPLMLDTSLKKIFDTLAESLQKLLTQELGVKIK